MLEYSKGADRALIYLDYAMFLEKTCAYDEAEEYYLKGLEACLTLPFGLLHLETSGAITSPLTDDTIIYLSPNILVDTLLTYADFVSTLFSLSVYVCVCVCTN